MAVPILKLSQLSQAAESSSLCNIFGIFRNQEANYWNLIDESSSSVTKIKLCGNIKRYPTPIHGDIIRIHRLSFDNISKIPIIFDPRNVLIWTSFEGSPRPPITVAKNPTIETADEDRRYALEKYFLTLLTPIHRLTKNQSSETYFSVAGRVDEVTKDEYSHINLMINDGTDRINLRVFKKENIMEVETHFETASNLQIGDFIVASSTKLIRGKLDLSANLLYGRYLRGIDRNSILGKELCRKLGINETQPNFNMIDNEQNNNSSLESTSSQPRRSKRIRDKNGSSITPTRSITPSPKKVAHDVVIQEHIKVRDIPQFNNYHRYYNLAGQVRGQPNETPTFQNWVFQLHDGSVPVPQSFHADLVNEPVENCVTILVYSKQKPTDTGAHIEQTKQLCEGDLVYIKNLRTSWINNKLKLEMNANLTHGKSIEKLKKDSPLGIQLIEQCSFPQVEELTEDPSQESINVSI